MELDKQQIADIEKRVPLLEKECWVCGARSWNLSPIVVNLVEFAGGGLVVGEEVRLVPVISIACNSCGHVVLFSAVWLGVIKPNG